jgi:hypothetical protein
MSENVTKIRAEEETEEEIVEVSESERELLANQQQRLLEARAALGDARQRFLVAERKLEKDIHDEHLRMQMLLDMVGGRVLGDRTGDWDFRPDKGGFVKETT